MTRVRNSKREMVCFSNVRALAIFNFAASDSERKSPFKLPVNEGIFNLLR
jgi:hypothetical protein